MRISIPEEARVWALKRQVEIEASDVVQSRPNYTGFSSPLRYAKGSIGEWALRHYLDGEGVYYRTDDAVGEADKLDILVRHDKAGLLRLDVKTSYDDELKVSERQMEKKKRQGRQPDGYVLVQRNPELTEAVIVGYISHREFLSLAKPKEFKKGGEALVVPPEKLRAVEDLAAHLSRGSKAWRFRFEGGAGTMISQRALSEKEVAEAIRKKFGCEPEVVRL